MSVLSGIDCKTIKGTAGHGFLVTFTQSRAFVQIFALSGTWTVQPVAPGQTGVAPVADPSPANNAAAADIATLIASSMATLGESPAQSISARPIKLNGTTLALQVWCVADGTLSMIAE